MFICMLSLPTSVYSPELHIRVGFNVLCGVGCGVEGDSLGDTNGFNDGAGEDGDNVGSVKEGEGEGMTVGESVVGTKVGL